MFQRRCNRRLPQVWDTCPGSVHVNFFVPVFSYLKKQNKSKRVQKKSQELFKVYVNPNQWATFMYSFLFCLIYHWNWFVISVGSRQKIPVDPVRALHCPVCIQEVNCYLVLVHQFCPMLRTWRKREVFCISAKVN